MKSPRSTKKPTLLPKLVDTVAELRANVVGFTAEVKTLAGTSSAEADALANGCSHAVEWVGFEDRPGTYLVAFSKYAGYNALTPRLYDQLRQSDLTGTDTKRRVEKLGGISYPVGADAGPPSSHPAVAAVKAVCGKFGKAPKRTAKVRVFTAENRPVALDILLAAIRAANLKERELAELFAEVRAAA